ncbi:T9SS type A sorting domain-containing protein [Aureibacter tunicatorum]|uniref:Holliday junction resolvase-like endonuclease n=1 Tax=Aureibacter tunicatorum TaxID=866807 RepID=A0AAE3XNI3_9BACT|nr:GLUG motif-containing protein [Aureibacter tunicatorum]MDR6238324.1 putative Holliday junction resolvase-like endonuclease [Aureibacter tunicatorum]BDD03356.1 hypothetical protein AUTU_08390 [Aureibacter tunicatorum]
MKKIYLIVLVVMQAFYAFAQSRPDIGDGTESSPYQISTIEHLKWLSEGDEDSATNVNRLFAYYELMNDIDASETSTWNEGKGFTPIGNLFLPFGGVFEGNGFSINDVFINRPTNPDSSNAESDLERNEGVLVGFFSLIGGGTVTNLNLVDVDIQGFENVGGLAGGSFNGMITNVSVSGIVRGEYFVGGALGASAGDLLDSYSTVDVTGHEYVGGLAGRNGMNIRNCFATGSVTGENYVGGLAGENLFEVVDALILRGNISECYATGTVLSDSINVGGLLGFNTGMIESSYWDVETTGQRESFGSGEDFGLFTSEFANADNFEGWNFQEDWVIALKSIIDANPRPYLISQIETKELVFSVNDELGGSVDLSSGLYVLGEVIEVEADTEENYYFKEWRINGAYYSAENPLEYEVLENAMIEAVFKLDTFEISTEANIGGKIMPSNPVLEYGDDQVFQFVPQEGYYIEDVVVDGESYGSIQRFTFVNVDADGDIEVTFRPFSRELNTIETVGSVGGTIMPSNPTVEYGDTLEIRFVPEDGYIVSNVVLDGDSLGAISSYMFLDVESSQKLQVEFSKVQLTVDVNQNEGGDVEVSETSFEYGGDVEFILKPNSSYSIRSVSINGMSIVNDLKMEENGSFSYELSDVTDNLSLSVIFEKALGLSDINEVNAYPNPVSTVLTISNLSPNQNIEILNVLGKVVMFGDSGNGGDVKVDVKNLKSGTYILRVDGKKAIKVLKQ